MSFRSPYAKLAEDIKHDPALKARVGKHFGFTKAAATGSVLTTTARKPAAAKQVSHQASPKSQNSQVKAGKPTGESVQAAAAKGRTSQAAAAKVTKPAGDVPRTSALNEERGCGDVVDLWTAAQKKALAEMMQEFVFESLCVQGKKLFYLVYEEKTKRLYGKLKARQKWKARKQGRDE